MKTLRVVSAVALVIALGAGATGCSTVLYTGPAVVKEKEVDQDKKKSSSSSKKKSKSSSKTVTSYELTLDIENSDIDLEVDVPKEKYDSIKVNQTVQVVDGQVK